MALKSNKVEMLIKLLGGVKNSSEDPVSSEMISMAQEYNTSLSVLKRQLICERTAGFKKENKTKQKISSGKVQFRELTLRIMWGF